MFVLDMINYAHNTLLCYTQSSYKLQYYLSLFKHVYMAQPPFLDQTNQWQVIPTGEVQIVNENVNHWVCYNHLSFQHNTCVGKPRSAPTSSKLVHSFSHLNTALLAIVDCLQSPQCLIIQNGTKASCKNTS